MSSFALIKTGAIDLIQVSVAAGLIAIPEVRVDPVFVATRPTQEEAM